MKSQRYLSNYKCECYGHTFCNCPDKSGHGTIFMENIYDVAETLAQIMVICGIHQAKAKAAIDVIIYSFIHYDEIRHRIDTVPRKRLCKEDLIHDLGRKCLMSRMEAQLTYSIIKRAFKAFYHGTSEGGIRNPILEAQMVHSQECLWVHAAKRTAQIFASYEGLFFSAQKNYEALIKCLYKKLYDRLQSRTNPLIMSDCLCKGCVQRTVMELPKPSRSMYSIHGPISDEENLRVLPVVNGAGTEAAGACEINKITTDKNCNTVNGTVSSTSLSLPRCYKCNCPRLICDCDVNQETGVVKDDCGQGPYKCQWKRMDENDVALKRPCLELPVEHECPIDCDGESVICDPECECDCESCECHGEDSDSDYDEAETVEEKVEEEDQLSNEATNSTICNISGHGFPGEYDECRVPIVGHVVEEEPDQLAAIARVVEHIQKGSVTSAEVEDEMENEGAEINKILATLI
ncbi:uncharacterized protein LOC101452067 [Ceratitis capitata]|uniref:uncharacterized protein LOC101452067 n=1 Tax=Ceratitis capitata TaxID=7213 RepID=UPI000329A79D|nr:uncharacterized protein LOC101452067 [Ceratitis capitata]